MKIIYFSPIDWSFLKQRPQHIAEELSKHYTVYYIEPSISVLSSIIKNNNSHKPRQSNINDMLKVIRINGSLRLPKMFDLIDITGLNLAYERLHLKRMIGETDLLWLGSPIYYGLIKHFKNKVIYDKMDDNAQLTNNMVMKRLLKKNEKKLLSRAELTFTTSITLFDEIKAIGAPVELVRNGLDSSLYSSALDYKENQVSHQIRQIKKNDTIVFGYIGTIDHWFDYEAINQIISHSKKFKVVIVGHNNLPKHHADNVYYFDPVPKSDLSAIINEFDYCLYTFKKNSLLDSIDPVKIYEYLSFNKKVIAVQSVETIKFKKHVKLYTDLKELENLLRDLSSIQAPFTNEELNHFVEDNSWEQRVSKIRLFMIKHNIY